MRRLTIIIAFLLCALSLRAQGQFDFNNPSIPVVANASGGDKVVSGHSVSASILGLEYAYEQALGKKWSIVFRAGLPSVVYDFTKQESTTTVPGGYSTKISYNASFGPRPGVSVEPRYYVNMESRMLKGKNTANNCANFWSVRTVLYYPGPDGGSEFGISTIPMFGMRRGHQHWFREYTLGAGFHTMSYGNSHGRIPILPHLNFRIGYTF